MDSSKSPKNELSLDDTTEMTSSYHEICEEVQEGDSSENILPGAKRFFDKARNWVGDLSMDGVVSQEGQQLAYVAQDLEERIRSSPKRGREGEEAEGEGSMFGDFSTADLNVVVNEMEVEAKKLASSVDTLTENLTGILHSLSSMTVDCVFTASDGVSQLCDTADASIKVMYQVMAKAEELNKAVQPLYQLHQQVKETKRLLDKVEAEMN